MVRVAIMILWWDDCGCAKSKGRLWSCEEITALLLFTSPELCRSGEVKWRSWSELHLLTPSHSFHFILSVKLSSSQHPKEVKWSWTGTLSLRSLSRSLKLIESEELCIAMAWHFQFWRAPTPNNNYLRTRKRKSKLTFTTNNVVPPSPLRLWYPMRIYEVELVMQYERGEQELSRITCL